MNLIPDKTSYMIRLNSILIFIIFCFYVGMAQDRDVFDFENSRKFANYLYDSGQYELASDEYERVVFMNPGDSLSILHLLASYRHQQKFDIGVRRAFELLPERLHLSEELFGEIFRLSLLSKSFQKGSQLILERNSLNERDKRNYTLSIMLLEHDYIGSKAYIEENGIQDDPFYDQLRGLVNDYPVIPNKNPYVAAGMSTIIPGTGKIYTGEWQDGLVALLFVASNAWQAYRGFSKDGVKSAYGWVFGSITTGFWLGNIYGSFRSARKFNDKQKKRYYESVERTVFGGI